MKVTPHRYLTVTVLAGLLFFLLNTSTAQIITTVAGVGGYGSFGFSGDGGPATKAVFNKPKSLIFDEAGNLYISDWNNHRIRKVDTKGIITTIAGNGGLGCEGSGMQAASTSILASGFAFDKLGNLYTADYDANVVRKISPNGIISTVASFCASYTHAYSGGDGGLASQAYLNAPTDVIFDASGNLCIADYLGYRIRKITPDSIISTIVGNGTKLNKLNNGDSGLATLAQLYNPSNIAFDANGNLYVSDKYCIRKIDKNGIITTVVGSGQAGYSGDNGPAIKAKIWHCGGIAFDAVGNLYFSDAGNNVVRKVDLNGIITTVVGNAIPWIGNGGDGGSPLSAGLANPQGLVFDKSGNLYIADYDDDCVRKVTFGNPPPSPSILSFTPNATCPGTSIPVFITGANFTKSISAVTVGGTAVDSFRVNSATSITAYISNGNTGKIAVTSPDGTATSDSVFTFGKGYTAYAYLPNTGDSTVSVYKVGLATALAMKSYIKVGRSPSGICVSPDGTKVFLSNIQDNTVSVINTPSNSVTATIAVGNSPNGLCISPNGSTLYVTNNKSNTLSTISTVTNAVVSTINIGNSPSGICISPNGTYLYVANANDNTVSVVNTATNSIVAIVLVGHLPTAICITPDGSTVYTTNFNDATVSVINTITNAVISTVSVGVNPCAMCINQIGTSVFIANQSSNTISVINTSNHQVTAVFSVDGKVPTGISISPDGKMIYVTNAGDSTLSIFNAISNSLLLNFPFLGNKSYPFGNFIANVPTPCAPPAPPTILSFTPNATCPGTSIPVFITGANFTRTTSVTVGGTAVDTFWVNSATSITAFVSNGNTGKLVVTSPDGTATSDSVFTFGKGYKGYVYVGGSDTITVLDGITRKIVGSIPVGKGPTSINTSPDGTKVYVTNINDANISVINTTTNTVIATIPVGNQPTRSCISPDGATLYQANSGGNVQGSVFVINTITNKVIATIITGNGTSGICISPDGKLVYATNLFDNTLSVINSATNKIIKTIPIAISAPYISTSNDGSLLYLPNPDKNSLTIMDASTFLAITDVPLGNLPYASYCSPDGSKIYVTDENNLSVINASNYTLIATIPVGNNSNGISISSNGKELYILSAYDSSTTIINTETNKVEDTIKIGSLTFTLGNFIANVPTTCAPPPPPTILSFAPNATCPGTSIPVFIAGSNFTSDSKVTVGGTKVDSLVVNSATSITAFISNGNTGKVVVTNFNGTATSDSVFTFGIGYRGYAYIATGNNAVSVYDAVTRKLVAIVPVGKGASSINASPDGSKVFVSNSNEGTVTIISTKDNTVETTLQMGNQLTRSCFSPDGSKFYQCDYAGSSGNKVGNVYVINTANDSIITSIACGNGTYGICISPDGTLVYATNSYDRTVSVINTATNKVINTFSIGFAAIYITISSDGAKLYLPNSSNNTVTVIDALTHTVITTVPVDNNPQILCLSADGSKLYVDNAAGTTVNVINTATNTVIATIQVGNNPSGLSLSADGTELYVPDHDGNITIINTLSNKVKATIAIGGLPIAWGNFIANVHTCGTPPSIPSIISFTPNAICTGSKTIINISGNYFGGATAVTIGGISADSFTINSASSITAYISNGNTGLISVVTPFGTAVSDSTFTFGSTYTAAVYVASYAGSLVNVIDAATKQVTDTFSVGNDALGVCVSHNGQRAYIGHFTVGSVSVINTAANKVIARIPVGQNPFGICISKDDARLYVANQKDNTVSVVSTANNTVIATIPTGIAPRGICIDPYGTKVYVANSNDNTITVINTSTNTVTDNIAVGIQPIGVCINPEGTKLYVVNDGSNTVSVINTATNIVIATVKVGSQPAGISISPDASKIYVANTVGNSVSVINTTTNTVIATVAVGKQPDALSVSPNGKEVYVANANDGSVSVINTLTNTVTSTVPVVLYPSFFGNSIANVPTSCTPTPPPVISSFNPIVSCTGATITIKGEGFTKITGVSFGNVAAASFKVLNDSIITAFVGDGASGSIVVSSKHGNATITGFTFIRPDSSTTKVSICQDSTYKFNGVTYNKAGTYSAHLTNSGGCDSTAILILSIDTTYTLYPIGGNPSVCAGETTPLNDITPKGTWSSDNNLIATVESDGLVKGIIPGSTNIRYSVLSGCGNRSTSQAFDVLGVKPTSVIYTPNKANCIQPLSGSITVSSVKGIVKESPYHFSINEVDKFNIPYTIPDLVPDKYTIYIYNSAGCLVDAIYAVKIDFDNDAVCDTLYVPSAFVPTSRLPKGINRILRPFGGETSVLTLTFRVFNRYGNLIYETHELNEGWNGTVNGVLQDAGTYIWTLEYTRSFGRHWSTKGTSVLIR